MGFVVLTLLVSAVIAGYILVVPAPAGGTKDLRARSAWAAPALSIALALVALFVLALWVLPALGYEWGPDLPENIGGLVMVVLVIALFLPLFLGSVLGSAAWRQARKLSTLLVVLFDTAVAALVVVLAADGRLWVWVPAVAILLSIDALLARPWQHHPGSTPPSQPVSASPDRDLHHLSG